jgi:hypothetical protein
VWPLPQVETWGFKLTSLRDFHISRSYFSVIFLGQVSRSGFSVRFLGQVSWLRFQFLSAVRGSPDPAPNEP